MALGLWLLKIGAMLLAFGAGFSFGRATPSWRIDRANEDVSGLRERYDRGHRTAGGGCGRLLTLFFQGAWGTGLMVLAALIVSVFAWLPVAPEGGAAPSSGGGGLLRLSPLLLLPLIGLAGYIVSRLTDRGPMGPLE